MELQGVVELFFDLMSKALLLSVISKAVSEGIIDAWSVQNAWFKRLLVLAMNGMLTYYVMFVLGTSTIYEFVILLLFTCAGAEAIHSVINQLKNQNQVSLPETTEFDDSEE